MWLWGVESWVRIKNIMGYICIADRRTLVSIWSHDRKWSQTIAEDRTWFYLLRSSAITIAGDRRSVFPYDRRRSQNFLRSAIRDCLRSYGNQPLAEQTNYLFYCEPNLSDTTLWYFSGQVSKVLTFSSETVLLRISLKRTIRFQFIPTDYVFMWPGINGIPVPCNAWIPVCKPFVVFACKYEVPKR